MNWREFWNNDHSIYVSDRHRDVHYQAIADGILSHVPEGAIVLDYGCGEALCANLVAARAQKLILCDGAPSVVERLQARFATAPNVAACLPETLDQHLADGEADRIIMVSVAQYLSKAEMSDLAKLFHRKLKAGGLFVLADIIKPDSGLVADTASLLRSGWRHGYFIDAVQGLIMTAFSDYPKLRKTLGLTRYGEDESLALLREAGFAASRHASNIGLNQHRMTVVATKSAEPQP